jgi:hypothetical protein
MSLSELEQHVFAYYVATAANDLNIATRWYPRGELLLIIEDKFQIAVRKFGMKARACAKSAATAFLDLMIEKGGWESKQNEYGGSMHQFQLDTFRKVLKDLQATNPIIQQAQAGGADFWSQKFAALTA